MNLQHFIIIKNNFHKKGNGNSMRRKEISFIILFTLVACILLGCSKSNDDFKTDQVVSAETPDIEDVNNTKNDKTDNNKRDGSKGGIIVDDKPLQGTYSISECLQRSNEVPLVFYLLGGMPKKDALVEAVVMFYQGKVVQFDNATIISRYKENTIGDLIRQS